MSATFNTFDLIFMAFSLLFIVVAFFRGFVKEIFSLLIWVVALMVSHFGAPVIAKLLTSYTGSKLVLDVVSRILLFIFTFFGLLFATSDLVDNIKEKMPSLLDRSLGIFYGILKSLLIFGAVYAITANLYGMLLGKKGEAGEKKVPQWMVEAKFGKVLKMSGAVLDPAIESFIGAVMKNFDKSGMMPKSLDDKIDEVIEEDKTKPVTKDHDLDFQARTDQVSETKTNKDNKKTKSLDEETGYDKKNIDKLGRLIDIIDKTN